jgi:hypothetical protein
MFEILKHDFLRRISVESDVNNSGQNQVTLFLETVPSFICFFLGFFLKKLTIALLHEQSSKSLYIHNFFKIKLPLSLKFS